MMMSPTQLMYTKHYSPADTGFIHAVLSGSQNGLILLPTCDDPHLISQLGPSLWHSRISGAYPPTKPSSRVNLVTHTRTRLSVSPPYRSKRPFSTVSSPKTGPSLVHLSMQVHLMETSLGVRTRAGGESPADLASTPHATTGYGSTWRKHLKTLSFFLVTQEEHFC